MKGKVKYSAINIGPILKTLGLARKPREMWAASYLFSYLMKCIINAIPDKKSIISPAIISEKEYLGIGLYPDRLFVKGEILYDTIQPAIEKFSGTLNLDTCYFNVMLISGDYQKDSIAIKDLNNKLNRLELFNIASPQTGTDKVRELIARQYGSPLFMDAFGDREFPVESLGEIAAVEVKERYPQKWGTFKSDIRSKDTVIARKAYGKLPKDMLKSYHKYICVVKADGDNMGVTVTHSQLPEGKVLEISTELLEFGKKATQAIREFGGLPIFAGGDDLLFIAPVVGKNDKSILWLLEKLNNDSFGKVKSIVENLNLKFEDDDNKGKEIRPSLSFGVSVSYYKYPLYEAFDTSEVLLKRAKAVSDKNAIALELRKHSGGTFGMELSNNDIDLKEAFNKMIEASAADESVVSAIAHKIRVNEGLLKIWEDADEQTKERRNGNFFRKFIEHDPEKPDDKKNENDRYKDAALALLNKLYKQSDMNAIKLTITAYGMLRIAKFINGEEARDE